MNEEEGEIQKESTKKKLPTINYKIVDAKDQTIYEGDSRVLAVKGYSQPHSMRWLEKTDKEPEYIVKFRRPDPTEIWTK